MADVEADVPYPQCRRHRSAGYTRTGRGTRGTPSPEVLLCRVGVLSSFGQDILDGPGTGLRPEQHKLVRPSRARPRGIDARDVRGDRGEDIGVERPHLGQSQSAEPEGPRQLVDRHGPRPQQLGQAAAARPRDQLELERAILSVAEAQREPGVGVVAGLDVRDPPSVTIDDDLVVESRHRQ